MQHALDAFLTFASRHPSAALSFIALVAFAESLAIVGTLVPAAIVMFGAGVLVGHGTLPLSWTLAVAATGAVTGDALSYEVGRRGQDRVRSWPLFCRHPVAIEKAEQLIARHGALSVVIARFTGAVRAFVPLLAGLTRMPAGSFYATNVASALLWAPAHILPGLVFGASLRLAEQASGRLALLIVMLAALVWGATWLARITIRLAVPLTRMVRIRVLAATGSRTALWARFLRLLLDPEEPGSAALLAALLVLIGSMWLFLGIAEDVTSGDPLVVVDASVFTFLQALRTEPVDRLMVAITEMGSVGVMLPLVLSVTTWLVVQRCWRTAGYWVATVASAEIVVLVMKHTLGRHRPLALYEGIEQYSFPSGHATMSAVVLAYLAFLVTRGQSKRWRIVAGAAAAVYVALVGFSRLYLGAHWLSDVAGGFSFGLAAVALSAMVYTQHRVDEAIQPRRIALVAGATILVAAGVSDRWRTPDDLRRYAMQAAPVATTPRAWTNGGFRLLPAHRHEVAGEMQEAFTVQIGCPETALRELLRRAGWLSAPGLSVPSVLQAVAPHPSVREIPVLPKYDGGLASTIDLMQVPEAKTNERNVVRLWKSAWELAPGVPIWYGAYYREVQVHSEYSLLRQESEAPSRFGQALASAGLRRAAANLSVGGTHATELWICAGL